MKPLKAMTKAAIFIAIVLLFLGSLCAQGEHEIEKTFKNIKTVRLQTFSGDCIIKKTSGSEISLHFIHSYSKTGFEPQFQEEGDTLILKEKFHLSGSGDSTWNLAVPDGTTIHSQSISGNFTVEGVKGNITTTTVSGDIAARDCSGQLDLKSVSGELDVKNLSGTITLTGVSSDLEMEDLSGELRIKTVSGDIKAKRLDGALFMKCPSGDINIKEAKGNFDIKAASGDIKVEGIIISKASSFQAASGSIYVGLAKSAEQDLTLESASGDVILNYNGNPIEGYFEFKALAERGDIVSPFPFEKEEEVDKWGKKYTIKSFTRELDIPKIYIYTASGKAQLKEK